MIVNLKISRWRALHNRINEAKEYATNPKKLEEKLKSEVSSMSLSQGLKVAVKLDETFRKRKSTDLSMFCYKEKHPNCDKYLEGTKQVLGLDIKCECAHHVQ